MAILIDTNIIIRFLIGDHEQHLQESTKIFQAIEGIVNTNKVILVEASSLRGNNFFVF